MIRRACTLGVVALVGLVQGTPTVLANAPDRSIRPEARATVAPTPVAVPVRFDAQVRPRPRTAFNVPDLRQRLEALSAPPGPAAVASTPASPPDLAPIPVAGAPVVRFDADLRPRPRPWLDRTRPSGTAQGDGVPVPSTPPPASSRALASTAPVFVSPRPPGRPQNLQRRATVVASGLAQAPATPRVSPSGAICGDPNIQGRAIPAIPGRLAGCGIANPVQVTSVHGIALSTAATMDCQTAQALSAWVRNGAVPAVGNMGNGIAQFRVAAHYACRTRNSQPGARISEHGKGRAIDISAIRLRNGETITLLEGWGDRRQGPVLRRMWQAACGPFGTVLGPEANRFHRDHFHFDTARYRSGPYCR